MSDWSAFVRDISPRRASFASQNQATASSFLWGPSYQQPAGMAQDHSTIWTNQLQPSTNIWGPQVNQQVNQQVKPPPGNYSHAGSVPSVGSPGSVGSVGSVASLNGFPRRHSHTSYPSPTSNALSQGSSYFAFSGSPTGPVPAPMSAAGSAHPNRSHSSNGGAQGASRRTSVNHSQPMATHSTHHSAPALWFEDPYLVSPPPSPPSQAMSSYSPPPTGGESSPVSIALDAAPAAASEEIVISSAVGPLYVVQFKGSRVDVFTAPGTAVYAPSDIVMVDADRGRDLGTVIAANVTRYDAAALKQRQHKNRQQLLHGAPGGSCATSTSTTLTGGSCANNGNGQNVYTPKQILAHASPSEVRDMAAKSADEAAAVALCNKKAAERNLDMSIVDAEYQWDRRKLTFFYTADTRVDFRELVRELFRMYKTRIWMCATATR